MTDFIQNALKHEELLNTCLLCSSYECCKCDETIKPYRNVKPAEYGYFDGDFYLPDNHTDCPWHCFDNYAVNGEDVSQS